MIMLFANGFFDVIKAVPNQASKTHFVQSEKNCFFPKTMIFEKSLQIPKTMKVSGFWSDIYSQILYQNQVAYCAPFMAR
jgi:hypothetical protein